MASDAFRMYIFSPPNSLNRYLYVYLIVRPVWGSLQCLVLLLCHTMRDGSKFFFIGTRSQRQLELKRQWIKKPHCHSGIKVPGALCSMLTGENRSFCIVDVLLRSHHRPQLLSFDIKEAFDSGNQCCVEERAWVRFESGWISWPRPCTAVQPLCSSLQPGSAECCTLGTAASVWFASHISRHEQNCSDIFLRTIKKEHLSLWVCLNSAAP